MKEFLEMFQDKGIKLGKYRVKSFSPLWWVIRLSQGMIGLAIFWLMTFGVVALV